ncbi:MAG: NAD(P)-binding domain-containing protein, partial [Oscillospiraceae bacterium]|nr:NAD(P)-binding domain-containing protein [Oscillospiraceae bacterium]
MNVSVFGSGAWGTAIALLVRGNGHGVTLWSKFPEEAEHLRLYRENPLLSGVEIPGDIAITDDVDMAVKGAEAAIIAVPSFAVRETAQMLYGRLSENC